VKFKQEKSLFWIKKNSKITLKKHFIQFILGLLFLSAVLVTAFCIWLGVTVAFHTKALRNWQATHWVCYFYK